MAVLYFHFVVYTLFITYHPILSVIIPFLEPDFINLPFIAFTFCHLFTNLQNYLFPHCSYKHKMSLHKPYSVIRIRKNIQNQKSNQKELFKDFAYSTDFKKSLQLKLNPENSDYLTARTQLMVKAQKIQVPDLIVTSGRSHLNTRPSSPRGKTVTGNEAQTTHVENARYLNQTKPTFRVKNISYLLSPMKSSISSVMTPKAMNPEFENVKSVPNFEEPKENEIEKINYQSTRLNRTKSIKRLRDERCLIATTRRLPFSLERKNTKRKFTEKTNFTNGGEDLFEVDISTIMDQNEPDTPFLRRDSGLEAIINMS